MTATAVVLNCTPERRSVTDSRKNSRTHYFLRRNRNLLSNCLLGTELHLLAAQLTARQAPSYFPSARFTAVCCSSPSAKSLILKWQFRAPGEIRTPDLLVRSQVVGTMRFSRCHENLPVTGGISWAVDPSCRAPHGVFTTTTEIAANRRVTAKLAQALSLRQRLAGPRFT
jgi:hypothetical protein